MERRITEQRKDLEQNSEIIYNYLKLSENERREAISFMISKGYIEIGPGLQLVPGKNPKDI